MRFSEGDLVRVIERSRSGHVRTPSYIFGKTGVISRIHGSFRNPEQLAYGEDGLPKAPLYYVAFDAAQVWGGSPRPDKVIVDIYEHWLEPA
ncbi:MAG: nitrile hydratase subunit beta [Chloroflexi bacterium]|nr:nitrile hydratase subunit beta [Chloroflexota bacterium]